MHLARLNSDLLIMRASSSVMPSAPVRDTDSEPARSTRLSLDTWMERVSVSRTSSVMDTTLWLRLLMSFMPVMPTARLESPIRTMCISSSALATYSSTAPSTKMPRTASCRMGSAVGSGLSRSRTRSM